MYISATLFFIWNIVVFLLLIPSLWKENNASIRTFVSESFESAVFEKHLYEKASIISVSNLKIETRHHWFKVHVFKPNSFQALRILISVSFAHFIIWQNNLTSNISRFFHLRKIAFNRCVYNSWITDGKLPFYIKNFFLSETK